MYKRQQYMNSEVSHEQYYGQFVTKRIKQIVLSQIGRSNLLRSRDEHLNDIPLRRWDAIVMAGTVSSPSINTLGIGKLLREANGSGGVSLSDMICILKEAARQIIAEHD